MVASPLPNREYRHLLQFYLAPKLGYGQRLLGAGLLILAGFGWQLLIPTSSLPILLAVSLPLLLAGNMLLLVRGYSLQPAKSLRRGTWEKTTRDQFNRLRQMEREIKNWDESFTDLTCVSGSVALILLALGAAVVWLLLQKSAATRPWAWVFVADAAVLLLPHWITGTRRGWRPVALRQIVGALETAVDVVDHQGRPPCQIQPLFEMAGTGERRVPINARVFIRFPDGPDGLLGLQFQVAINNVQGTHFPYLYGVIVAQKQFGLLDKHLEAIRDRLGPLTGKRTKDALVIESSREDDVEVIVIRQRTTKTSGYHTKPAAIRQLALAAWQSVEPIAQA